MYYLARKLEPTDHYYNVAPSRIMLPHDNLLDKPDQLAALSGPVKKYQMVDGELIGDTD